MPRFNNYENRDSGMTAGIGGAWSAIPIANILAPAISEAVGHKNEEEIQNIRGRNAAAIDTPGYLSYGNVESQYAGDVAPEGYGTPESIDATLAQESPEGRDAMLAALQDISRVTDQSVGSEQAQRRQQAEMDARQVANSREQAIKQDAMRRGRVGGAADMLSRQQAAQAAANMNQSAGLQSAEQAALQELAGVNAKANIGGNLRAGDQASAFKNADIMNLINSMNTKARNDASQHNVDTRNTMGLTNRDARQEAMNNATALDMSKIDRENALTGKKFGDQMTKYDAIDAILAAQAGETSRSAKDARAAGKEGYDNFKDLMKMVGGGMG